MRKHIIYLCALSVFISMPSCKKTDSAGDSHKPASPQYVAKSDYSKPPIQIDVEKALGKSESLKLSHIASEIEYYTVGDATFPVTQVLAVPGGFLTFNNPRTFLCRKGEKRKRYSFKALDYNWNSAMDGKNLYYDKASTKVYCALNKGKKDSTIVAPYIAELPPMDTLLLRDRYLFPEMLETCYPLNTKEDPLFAFSSSGYILRHHDGEARTSKGITTFSLNGDTLCRFDIGIDPMPSPVEIKRIKGNYSTSYRKEDLLTFLLPYCDTVYQLKDQETIAPLYNIHLGKHRASATELTGDTDLTGKAWPAFLAENPKGLFVGVYQEGEKIYLDWWNRVDGSKPVITSQIVYLKPENRTYSLPRQDKGLINDLDEGLYFWPDGQTDEYLYMIRTASELKLDIKLTGSPKQKELAQFLKTLPENQQVMIVVK